MNANRWFWLASVSLVVTAVGFATAVRSDESPQTDPLAKAPPTNEVSEVMGLKLRHAERVLEAVAVEDFDLLAKESQALSLLSQEAAFKVLVTPEYVRHSLDFRRAADTLTKAAKDKNLDGAALAYMDMTMKCVNCHKYVRDVRMAALPPQWK